VRLDTFIIKTVFDNKEYGGYQKTVENSVSNPGFPEPETRFFSTTKPGYFKKPGIAVTFKY